jgi:hypothetical protein
MSSNVSQSGDHLYQAPDDRPAVVSDVPARQAVTGHNVRYVLAVSLFGAVCAMAAAWAFYY